MRFFLGCVLASAILTGGCSGNDGKTPPSGPPVSDVKGSIIDTHVTETGDVLSTRGPMQFEIAAVVPNEDGTSRDILAQINSDGSFVIPSVPEVAYNLRFVEFVDAGALPPRYVMNAPREIDLGRVYVGRPDAVTINASPTNISLSATGLEPWADGDVLEMFSLGSSAAGELVPTNGTYPKAMDTSLTNYRVDSAELTSAKLVEAEKGDKAILTQLSGTLGAAAPYHSVRKVFEAPSFTQKDGGTTNLSGAFVDVPQKQFPLDINKAAFVELTAAVHPEASLEGKNVRIVAEPGGERATTSTLPNLLICEALPNAKMPASFGYGNPFPSEWAEVVTAEAAFSVTHMAPTGVPKSTIVSIGQTGPLKSITSPATPLLSPPVEIKINDQPAQDTLTAVGFSPTITFSPPTLGTAAVYIISIRRLDPGGGTTRTTAIFSTLETTLKIPEGLLDFGYYYYISVSVRTTFDIARPFRRGTTNAYASALSGVFTP